MNKNNDKKSKDEKADKGYPSLWTTLPGILTGIASLATAILGLLAVIQFFPAPINETNPLPPDIEAQLISNISSSLDSLESLVMWSLLALLAIVFSSIHREPKIKIANFEIDKQHAGAVVAGILCGVSFQSMRLFQNLASTLSQITTDTEKAKIIFRTHSSPFNPFSENLGFVSLITDNWGFALLLILWWLGFHTTLFLLRDANKTWKRIGYILSGLYLIFGLISLVLISLLIIEVNFETRIIKQVILFTAIPIGVFGIGSLVRWIQKQISPIANNETKNTKSAA